MPLRFFLCPDGIKREIATALISALDLKGVVSLPTLHELSYGREWKGKPSTTQLLNPTRMEYLKITKDYAITPQERAFALLGTQHHHRLDIIAKKIEELESEKKLSDDINTGILDLLEPDNGKWILTDYKTWGSFAVKKILDTTSYERLHNSLQLNDYRLKVESLGFVISKMRWQITVRDGGTFTAKNNGIEDKMPMIEADWLDDDFVTTYFYDKSKALLTALDKNETHDLCPFEERYKAIRSFKKAQSGEDEEEERKAKVISKSSKNVSHSANKR